MRANFRDRNLGRRLLLEADRRSWVGPAARRESAANRITPVIAGVIAEMPEFKGIKAIHIDYGAASRMAPPPASLTGSIAAKTPRQLSAPHNLDRSGVQHVTPRLRVLGMPVWHRVSPRRASAACDRSTPISVRQVAVLLRTAFRHHLAMTPLWFANPSPPPAPPPVG